MVGVLGGGRCWWVAGDGGSLVDGRLVSDFGKFVFFALQVEFQNIQSDNLPTCTFQNGELIFFIFYNIKFEIQNMYSKT